MKKEILNIGKVLNSIEQKEIFGGFSGESGEAECSNECFLTDVNPCGDGCECRESFPGGPAECK